MKREVIFVQFTEIDDSSPEVMLIHQFTKLRKFSIQVPLLIGFKGASNDLVAMIQLARNKRASIEYVEFFLHADHCPPEACDFIEVGTYLLVIK